MKRQTSVEQNKNSIDKVHMDIVLAFHCHSNKLTQT